jgi:O-succinylbenzoic acid--CoA ligase
VNIRINHVRCTDLSSLPPCLPAETAAFLREWFDGGEYVTGRTSGSTGAPKTVALPKRDMLASAALTNGYFGVTSRSVLLLCLSPAYIAGKMMIVRAIAAGARLLAVAPGSNPLAAIDCPVDFAAMTPLQVATSLSFPGSAQRLAQVGQLIIGGAAVPPPLEERLHSLPAACYATYGMTETMSHVALRRLNGSGATPFYTALGSVRFDADDRDCLLIDAPHLQQQRFVTNDVVQLCSPVRFRWLGRFDNIINSGGIKLSPENIEAKLAHLLSKRFFIAGEPDMRLGQRVALVIEDRAWGKREQEALIARIRQHLPPYECPKCIRFVPSFRETPSGKIIRAV